MRGVGGRSTHTHIHTHVNWTGQTHVYIAALPSRKTPEFFVKNNRSVVRECVGPSRRRRVWNSTVSPPVQLRAVFGQGARNALP